MKTRIVRLWAILCVCVASAAGVPAADAQGCVCQKQGSPVFGGLETYLKPGEWQVTFGYRGYESTEHFQGKNPFPELDPNGPINKQHAATGELTYGLTERWNVSVAAPWYSNGFAVRRAGPASSTPYFQDTPVTGVGDLSVRGRGTGCCRPTTPNRNVSVSGGREVSEREVQSHAGPVGGRAVPADVSIQLGDKAWGVTTGVSAFRDYSRAVVLRHRQLSLYTAQHDRCPDVLRFADESQ